MEFLAGMGELLFRDEPLGPEEMRREVANLLARRAAPSREMGVTAAEQAQALADAAWDAGEEGAEIALDALRLDPNCTDAYVYLGYNAGTETQLAFVLFTLGMMAGAETLGMETFERHAGEFHAIPEARPFLRAIEAVGHAALAMGAVDAAVEYFEEMLRLDVEDHMEIRYALLAVALGTGNREMADALFASYEGDSAVWSYGHALHAFRILGDVPQSRRWLREAVDQNPHMPPYVLGERPLPDDLPDDHETGTEDEAIVCLSDVAPMWHQTEGALGWLRAGAEAHRTGRRHWFAGLE